MAGISGSGIEGADSIVLNGGYEDDRDLGGQIIYTGHGGNDRDTGKQVADQQLKLGNVALAKSCINGLPVRVVRGWREPSGLGPDTGYRYDGLYRVDSYWAESGQSGYRVWRFRLLQIEERPLRAVAETRPGHPPRHPTTTQRIVRNTAIAQQVKVLYDYHCQVCGLRLQTPAGPYAEGAHIRPLGEPHDGPDTLDNLLCLCPNHHVLLDTGAIFITDDLKVRDDSPIATTLHTVSQHSIDPAHLAYRRKLFGRDR